MRTTLNETINLLTSMGYSISHTTVTSGGTPVITLYYKGMTRKVPVQRNFQDTLNLIGSLVFAMDY